MLVTRTLADELAEHWSSLARAMLSRRHSESVYGGAGPELSPGRRQAVLILDRGELRMGEPPGAWASRSVRSRASSTASSTAAWPSAGPMRATAGRSRSR